MEDNGLDGCSELKAHPAHSHVSNMLQTHTSNWWKEIQLNIGRDVADITGVRPFPPSAITLLLSLLCELLSHFHLSGWTRSSTAGTVLPSMKEPFIVTTSGPLERAFNAHILKVNAQKRGHGEDTEVKKKGLFRCHYRPMSDPGYIIIPIDFDIGKVRFQSHECQKCRHEWSFKHFFF